MSKQLINRKLEASKKSNRGINSESEDLKKQQVEQDLENKVLVEKVTDLKNEKENLRKVTILWVINVWKRIFFYEQLSLGENVFK